MKKKVWARGRKDPTCLVRIEADIFEEAKVQAEKDGMSLKAWVSLMIRGELMKRGL